MKNRSDRKISFRWIPFLCIFCFTFEILFTSRMWVLHESNGQLISQHRREQELQSISDDCSTKKKPEDVMKEILKTHGAIRWVQD